MRTRRSLLIVLAAASLSSACDDANVSIVGAGPTAILEQTTLTSRGVTVEPVASTIQPVHVASCPSQPPWIAPVDLVLTVGATDLFLSAVSVQFVDQLGRREPWLSIPQPDLFDRFGAARMPAFSRQTFPFSFGFGCLGRPPGTLTVVVLLRDTVSRETAFTTHVTIR